MAGSPEYRAVVTTTVDLVNGIAVDVFKCADMFRSEELITETVYNTAVDTKIEKDNSGRARHIVQDITANVKNNPGVLPKLLQGLRDLDLKDLAERIENKTGEKKNDDTSLNSSEDRHFSIPSSVSECFSPESHQSQQPHSEMQASRKSMHEVKMKINSLEKSFKKMAAKIREEIKNSKDKTLEFCEVMKECLPQPLQGLEEHIEYTSLEEKNVANFFNTLKYIYDFIDYELLEYIIDNFGTAALQKQFLDYKEKVTQFCAETTIMEFITCWEPRFDMNAIPPELIKCVTRMPWNSKTTKVEELKTLKKKLSKAVPQERAVAAFYMKEIHSSSVNVTWIVWTNNPPIVLEILRKITRDEVVLHQNNIFFMDISINNKSSSKVVDIPKKECLGEKMKDDTSLNSSKPSSVSECYNPEGHQSQQPHSEMQASWKSMHEANGENEATTIQETPSKTNELVVIMVAGKVGHGKSTALNNIYGLSLKTKYSSTTVTKDITSLDVEKNGVTVRVIDTPGLGSISLKTETVIREMSEVTKGHKVILLYCLAVKPSDILTEMDKVIIRNLRDALGVQVWQKCVLLLTFSDITREQEYPLPEQDEDYKEFLKDHAQQFQRVLQEESNTKIKVKTIFEYDSQEERENLEASDVIVAIPVQKEQNYKYDVLPGISHLYPKWTDAVVLELMKKKDAKDRVLHMIAYGGQNYYVKILAVGAVCVVIGIVIGAVTGIVGGPVGMIIGAVCGMAIGALALQPEPHP